LVHSQLRLCVPFKPLHPFQMPDTSHRMRHDSPSTTGRLRKLKRIKCGGPDNNGCGVRLQIADNSQPHAEDHSPCKLR
ncbi:MAG: hypothetical protein ACK6EB_17235, partial [Planctomyces sp.]